MNNASFTADSNFYSMMTGRNFGFVTREQQLVIKSTCVFIPGVGGMGGTALECLARMGIENFIIADFDTFEVSNLNRQIMCTTETIDKEKLVSAKNRVLQINPNAQIKTYGKDWVEHLDQILPQCDLVLNGCDDIKSTVLLARKSKIFKKFIIDAYASTLPNVYVIDPNKKSQEEFHGFTTLNKTIHEITPEIEKQSLHKEIQYIMAATSSINYVVPEAIEGLLNGSIKRFSFCPMVWMTSTLMCHEVLKIIFKKPQKVGIEGYFINPWTLKIECPKKNIVYYIKNYFVAQRMNKFL